MEDVRDCEPVYKIKYNSDNIVEWHKVCLVIFANSQVEGINYRETFARVAKMGSACTFSSVVVAK